MAVFPSRPVGGGMARRLLPAVIGLQVLLGWLCLGGQWAGLYNTAFGVALLVVANGIIFATLVWWTAGVLSRLDADRRQTEETLAERARLVALGADVGVALTQSDSLQRLLQRCAETMARHLDAAFARIWTLNEAQQMLELQASAGLYTHLDGPHGRVPVGQLKIGLIAQERKPHLTNTVIGDPQVSDQDWARREGMVAFAGYPLIVDGRLVGVMAMFAQHTLTAFTLGALASVADEIALGIERKRAEETLQHEAQITAVLARVGPELLAALKTPSLLDRLCQVTVEELGCDRSGVVFWQPEEKVYRMAAGYGYTPEQWERLRTLKLSSEAMGSVMAQLEEGEVVEVRTDTPQGPASQILFREFGTTATLCVGLWQGQELIGCQTAAYQGRTEFTPSQRRIARGIAQLASMALNNARLLEQAQSADRIKTAFLNAISHELRTPFNIILGYTDLLLDEEFGPLNVEQTDTLGLVRQAARGLFELVSTLLEASQLETRYSPVEMAEVDGDAFLAELRQETERMQAKPGLGWEWRVAPELPRLYTDRTKLKVILKNLLSNAVKFTPEGTVTVVMQPQRGGVEFCVSDTGIGIAPEAMSVVFEPFRQGDESLTRHYGGVGLRLHIVKRLVEVLGGTVSVESVVGHGSTFRVWLPAG